MSVLWFYPQHRNTGHSMRNTHI